MSVLPSIDTLERSQGMLDKHLATGVIVFLGAAVIALAFAYWRSSRGRIADLKEVNRELREFIGANTQATLIQNRALDEIRNEVRGQAHVLEERLPKKRGGGGGAPPAAPALPPGKEGAG